MPESDADEEQPLMIRPSRPLFQSGSRRGGMSSPQTPNDAVGERTALLDGSPSSLERSYSTAGPRVGFSRSHSYLSGHHSSSIRTPRHRPRGRTASFSAKVAAALQASWHGGGDFGAGGDISASKSALLSDERVWYDQYTSTDWVHDSIADNFRRRDLKSRKGIKGRLLQAFDGVQGWILAGIVGIITAAIAYFVDLTENAVFDIKEGYCTDGWHKSKGRCCLNADDCPLWVTWGQVLELRGVERRVLDFLFYVGLVMILSMLSCLMTLTTKTTVPSNVRLATLDENLAAFSHGKPGLGSPPVNPVKASGDAGASHVVADVPGPTIYYPAAGSGVAEVKVILSGFVIHGYLGVKTLCIKTLALILSVASGLSIGKEGPFVHIAACVGNVAARFFPKYNVNDGKRREVLSASAASGVAVAFGAPLAGTLFSLEEVSYYFPPKTLFRTFFCCIAAALSLKFLDPYDTGKIVIFEVRYLTDWHLFEIFAFIVLGVLGGALGAIFIKASRLWAQSFRRVSFIKNYPLLEVAIVALISGAIQFWNKHTKSAVTQLMYELASPCKENAKRPEALCPANASEVKTVILSLLAAFVVKAFLTTITFGIKVPAGIYVPSMVVGGLMGRIVGHAIQYMALTYPEFPIWSQCAKSGGPEACITPGVYALVAAGATMCGVTRLSVTLVVILFELTGSLNHVLPFSLAVLVAKWVADALEPLSIYDLLLEVNRYPFLDNKSHPIFTSELGDITARSRGRRLIDISHSPHVPVSKLRRKLAFLQAVGELDGGLPLVRDGVLVGMLPAPDLEFALDKLAEEHGGPVGVVSTDETGSKSIVREVDCLMAADDVSRLWSDEDDGNQGQPKAADLTDYIDPAPIALDVHSPMDLVYQCFVKLGLRYICVVSDGRYFGMIHKKAFVKYIKDLEAGKQI